MTFAFTRRALLAATAAMAVAGPAFAEGKIALRLSAVNTETDQRAISLTEVFGPAVADFATFEPH